jgi:hypothetical protein
MAGRQSLAERPAVASRAAAADQGPAPTGRGVVGGRRLLVPDHAPTGPPFFQPPYLLPLAPKFFGV